VINGWFKAHRELFVRSQVSDKGGVSVILPQASSKPIDLEILCDASSPYYSMLPVYEACLELFAAVCASQCAEGRKLVGGRHGAWISYDCLVIGIKVHW